MRARGRTLPRLLRGLGFLAHLLKSARSSRVPADNPDHPLSGSYEAGGLACGSGGARAIMALQLGNAPDSRAASDRGSSRQGGSSVRLPNLSRRVRFRMRLQRMAPRRENLA
jgi:hypothetical protein